jgi:hypothetical protein
MTVPVPRSPYRSATLVAPRRSFRWDQVGVALVWLMVLSASARLFLWQREPLAGCVGILARPIGLVAIALGLVALLLFVLRRRRGAAFFLLGALSLSFAPMGAAMGDAYERAVIDSFVRHHALHGEYPERIDAVSRAARSPTLQWMPSVLRPRINCFSSPSREDSVLCVRSMCSVYRRITRLPGRRVSYLD